MRPMCSSFGNLTANSDAFINFWHYWFDKIVKQKSWNSRYCITKSTITTNSVNLARVSFYSYPFCLYLNFRGRGLKAKKAKQQTKLVKPILTKFAYTMQMLTATFLAHSIFSIYVSLHFFPANVAALFSSFLLLFISTYNYSQKYPAVYNIYYSPN